MIIRDGSVGSLSNHFQNDISYQQLQGWGYLARCARNADSDENSSSPVVPTLIRDGSVGTAHNCYQIDIVCQWLPRW